MSESLNPASEMLMAVLARKMGRADAKTGDYYGIDDMLRCGVCNQPKEAMIRGGLIVPVLCACGLREREAQREADRRDEQRKTIAELRGCSLIDSRFIASTFADAQETSDNRRALTVARNYVAHWSEMLNAGKGLLFYGPPGTGKTFLAACIVNALAAKDISVIATSISALVTGYDMERLNEVIGKMRAADLLLLDDFGAERDTDYMIEQVFRLIDARYQSKKPMILTTNLSMGEMKTPDEKHARIFDRALSMCYPVKLDGGSWRAAETRETWDDVRGMLEG